MPLYLSIDFEDFCHDLKRDLGLWDTGPVRADALWRSYAQINAFLCAHGGAAGTKATFFCTGIIAEQVPGLIARIAADGHEIACHSHFHDTLEGQDIPTIRRMLRRAKDTLEDAAGVPVRGFRAPKFRIDTSTPRHYREIEAVFRYDSSLCADTREEARIAAVRLGLTRLTLLPLFSLRQAGLTGRMGGTFLKLLPVSVCRTWMLDAEAMGFAPQIYVHPYDFSNDGAYELPFSAFKGLGRKKAAYWWARQVQWNRVGNRSLPEKLARIIPPQGLAGRLCDSPALRTPPIRMVTA